MKPSGYIVRINDARISVEHRERPSSTTVAVLVSGYALYLCLPPTRHTFEDFVKTGDLFVGGFLLFFLLLPFISGATWLFFASGEVFFCDQHILSFAKRRTLGKWHKSRFDRHSVHGFTTALRGGPKQRTYTVLTFTAASKRFDVLENLSNEQTDQILETCKMFGFDVSERDKTSDAMLQDIEQRGWWINPLKPDSHPLHESEEQK